MRHQTKAQPLRDNIPDAILDLVDRAVALGVPGARNLILEAFDELVDGITSTAVEQAIATGSPTSIFGLLDPWEAFTSKLAKIYAAGGPLEAVMDAAATATAETLPGAAAAVDLEIVADRAKAWLQRRGAQQITVIDRNTRAAINLLVQDAFTAPDSRASAAKEILRLKDFGLNRPQAEAFERYVAEVTSPQFIVDNDLTGKQVQRLIDRRYQKMRKYRADLVADTEAATAGNATQTELWQQAVIDGDLDAEIYVLEWVTRLVNSCPRCEALDGTIAEITGGQHVSRPVASGTFAGQVITITGPTVHPTCFPGDVRVSGLGITGGSKRLFEGKFISLQTAGGLEVTCTGNHPILTVRGWVPAQDLVVSDYVLCDLGPPVVEIGAVKNENVPATFSEVFEALRGSVEMASVEVPVSAPDFHGDGTGSDVCVVLSNRKLRDEFAYAIADPFNQRNLVRALVRQSLLASLRKCAKPGFRRGYSTRRLVRSGSQPLALGHRHIPISNLPGLGHASNLHAAQHEPSFQGISGTSSPPGEGLHGLSGLVSRDQIVKVRHFNDQRHVYNLQTEQGWYVANGIIAHNCKCQRRVIRREDAIDPEEFAAA